jgi:hypothetical protein
MSALPPKADIETLVGKGNRRKADLLLSDDIKEMAATDGFLATAHERLQSDRYRHSPTKLRHCELIANLTAERRLLRKAQVVGISGTTVIADL